MGGRFPVRDRARDNNHRREITMLIFVAPQGVVWWGYRSLEGPHITRGLHWLMVINDQKSGPSLTTLPTVDPNRPAELQCNRASPMVSHRGNCEKPFNISTIKTLPSMT